MEGENGVSFRDGRGELEVAIWIRDRLFDEPTDQLVLASEGSHVTSKPLRTLCLGDSPMFGKC